MAGYIGKVQIGNNANNAVLIGSTLYGICTSLASDTAKTVISADDNTGKFVNDNYDNLIQGTTIHIKFTNGNTATSGITLQVGTTNQAKQVDGLPVCAAGTILSFTFDENEHWVVNDNVDTNTEYVFKTAYNASTNKVLTESDIAAAATKGVTTSIGSGSTDNDLPTAASVYSYVQQQTGGLAGLTGAMHFRGIVTDSNVTITDGGTENPNISTYTFAENNVIKAVAGDVIIFGAQEYVWTADGSAGHWELLGDEGSYALKDSVDTITEVGVFTANTLPTLTVADTNVSQVSVTNGSAASLTTNDVTIPNVTSAGSVTTASVTAGILNINLGTAPTISETPITVKEVNVFTANTPTAVTATPVSLQNSITFTQGTQASLTTNDTIVVVPVAPNP